MYVGWLCINQPSPINTCWYLLNFCHCLYRGWRYYAYDNILLFSVSGTKFVQLFFSGSLALSYFQCLYLGMLFLKWHSSVGWCSVPPPQRSIPSSCSHGARPRSSSEACPCGGCSLGACPLAPQEPIALEEPIGSRGAHHLFSKISIFQHFSTLFTGPMFTIWGAQSNPNSKLLVHSACNNLRGGGLQHYSEVWRFISKVDTTCLRREVLSSQQHAGHGCFAAYHFS